MLRKNGATAIKQFTPRHADTLALFGRCCNVTLDEAKNVGATKYMLDTFVNLGWLKPDATETESYYQLTKSGRKEVLKRLDFHPYHTDSREHDAALVVKYLDVYERGLQDSWMTEDDLLAYAKANNIDTKDCSITDGAYIDETGELHLVEIITNNYNNKTIEQKQQFVTNIGGHYDCINI